MKLSTIKTIINWTLVVIGMIAVVWILREIIIYSNHYY